MIHNAIIISGHYLGIDLSEFSDDSTSTVLGVVEPYIAKTGSQFEITGFAKIQFLKEELVLIS